MERELRETRLQSALQAVGLGQTGDLGTAMHGVSRQVKTTVPAKTSKPSNQSLPPHPLELLADLGVLSPRQVRASQILLALRSDPTNRETSD